MGFSIKYRLANLVLIVGDSYGSNASHDVKEIFYIY
jgi:hypothetical protein